MSETSFTPGPWEEADGGRVASAVVPPAHHRQIRRLPIADVSLGYKSSAEYFANLALIVAAPDLYAALDRLVTGPLDDGGPAAIRAAEAALAKARGEVQP
jgi:hypothetical protein